MSLKQIFKQIKKFLKLEENTETIIYSPPSTRKVYRDVTIVDISLNEMLKCIQNISNNKQHFKENDRIYIYLGWNNDRLHIIYQRKKLKKKKRSENTIKLIDLEKNCFYQKEKFNEYANNLLELVNNKELKIQKRKNKILQAYFKTNKKALSNKDLTIFAESNFIKRGQCDINAYKVLKTYNFPMINGTAKYHIFKRFSITEKETSGHIWNVSTYEDDNGNIKEEIIDIYNYIKDPEVLYFEYKEDYKADNNFIEKTIARI
ncbi:MAG: hypothetical protein WA945_04640 [Arcobacteraceae bacterium]